MNSTYFRWLRLAALGLIGLVLAFSFALACTFVYLAPGLPTARNMHDKELTVPLRIYTSAGGLISQIGEDRRIPVSYDEIPDIVRLAVLAAEDDRFFEHSGLDWMGVLRAVVSNVVTADATGQGGSTITQQAARNMFLKLDQTLRRKLSEVFVTYRMERDFSKEEILAIYLNVATFGQRAYGIAAAAETYYGKHLDQLTVSQVATLVGVLPAPSRYNPVTSPKLAEDRRHYVLGRMLKLGYIDEATRAAAEKEPVATRIFAPLKDVEAPYVGEMARAKVVELFGESALNAGYKVITTIDGREQLAANRAVRLGVLDYDRRHGYRGHLGTVQLPAAPDSTELDTLLGKFDSISLLQPAVVLSVRETSATVHIRGAGEATINWDGLSWAQRANKSGELYGPKPGKAADVVARGDVVFVLTDGRGSAGLAQLPAVQAAMVALDPNDGAVVALVGGFDYYHNQFNRVTQAKRQPGSGFKPILYSAALDAGVTAASVFLDAPVMLDRSEDDEENWRPTNSGGAFSGQNIRLREALVRSMNTISIRVLQEIGVDQAINHAVKFGFRKEDLPPVLPLALGAQSSSPWQMATAYATFANGGFKIEPYFISRIEDSTGKVLFEAKPKIVCAECELPVMAPLVVAEATEDAPDGDAAPLDTTAVAEAPGPRPRIFDVDAPPALRELARTQGGLGYLPADRLAPRVLSAQNAWLMTDILHDVAVRGTGQRSNSLGRDDLSGKTGTTQNYRDNWFNGFNHQLVASVWVGFDNDQSLGRGSEGSSTALPIWIKFMEEAMRKLPSSKMERPGGLVDLRVSPSTGVLADQNDPTAVYETFMVEHLPKVGPAGAVPGASGVQGGGGGAPLF